MPQGHFVFETPDRVMSLKGVMIFSGELQLFITEKSVSFSRFFHFHYTPFPLSRNVKSNFTMQRYNSAQPIVTAT